MADTPKLTDSQAAILRCVTADLGRAALAAYDAEQRRRISVEAMQACAKAVYPFDRDAFDAVCDLIAKEEA